MEKELLLITSGELPLLLTPSKKVKKVYFYEMNQAHPFHILGPSTFPFFTGFFLFCWLVPQVFHMHGLALPLFNSIHSVLIHAGFIGLFVTIMKWFLSVIKESSQGFHTKKVQFGLRLGMLLFIVSEVMLFFSFFWAFFHFSLVPSIACGNVWPPFGTQELDVWGLPLVNTILLLTSGVTITAAHMHIMKNNADGFFWQLSLTIILGITFLFCQMYEYKYGVKFSWRDNVYGSIFFITTGFHGLHVTIGTLFLVFCWMRHLLASILPENLENGESKGVAAFLSPLGYDAKQASSWTFEPNHHFGFEAAAWYWHFVDVVWLFLFLTIYWWGGK
jgi:heme/copper-type cytochrome/quinol oxidase subunit 3